jgi:arginyl-tRNA synthetase
LDSHLSFLINVNYFSILFMEHKMYDYKEPWKEKIASALNVIMKEAGIEESVTAAQIIAETPPNPAMGDIGFPMFSFAKTLRKGPPQIAQMAAAKLAAQGAGGSVEVQGPYLNVRLDRPATARAVLDEVFKSVQTQGGFSFGMPGTLTGKKVMVEFSSPNTNKPLHLGHLRNDVIGESVSRILAACGAQVRKVCIINDRGIHICKSMLAYQEQGQGKSPETEGIKSDHFVGDWYVAFSKALKT